MDINHIRNALNQQNMSIEKFQSYLKANNVDQATINQAMSIFKNLDRNHDNQINLEEWATADVDLKAMDTVDDGVISEEEVQNQSQYNLFKGYSAKALNTVLSAMGSLVQGDNPKETTNPPSSSSSPIGERGTPNPLSGQGSGDLSDGNEVSKLDKTKYEFDEQGNLITYPKEGESFKQTAARLGFKPGTPEYEEFVKANPQAGKNNWFKVGDKVKIPPSIQNMVNESELIDQTQGQNEVRKFNELHPAQNNPAEQDKGAGVDESQMPQTIRARIAQLKKDGNTYEITGDSQSGYKIRVTGGNYLDKNGIGEIEIQYDAAGNIKTNTQKYVDGKVVEKTYEGGEKTVLKANSAPQVYQDIMAEVQKQHGGKARLEYNAETKKYELIQTDLNDKNIKEIRTVLDSQAWQEKLSKSDAAIQGVKDFWNNWSANSPLDSLSKAKNEALRNRDASVKVEDYFLSNTVTYANGKVTEGTYVKGKLKTQTTTKEGTTPPLPEVDEPKAANSAVTVKDRTKLNVATDISFKMPPDAPKNAKTFANTLVENKEKLMEELGIDSDTYNMLAQTAMGIAAQETNFGESTPRQWLKNGLRFASDSVAIAQYYSGENKSYVKDWSHGITQLKYTLHINDKWVKTHMENLGITNELQLENPKTSAIATMVVLAKMNQEIDSEKYQNGIKTAQGTSASYPGWEMGENGIARKSEDGATRPWTNEISRQDVLCAFWNGGTARSEVENGVFRPQIWKYSRQVAEYTKEYKLEETSQARAEAIKKDSNQPKPFKNMTNNGDIGGVVFLPAMYTDKSRHMNTAVEIRNLDKSLSDKGIDGNLRRQLIAALQNGELSFDFGLRQEEIDALNEFDIKLLLSHLRELKTHVNTDSAINTEDGINSSEAAKLRSTYGSVVADAEDKFREEYLNSHSNVYPASDSNPKVLREQSVVENRNSYVDANGYRKGFKHEKAKKVNVNTTQGRISKEAETLANAGYSVVSENPNNAKSGFCLTGVKEAMTRAGIDVSGMTHYGNTPKYVQNWFAAHPEMFTPVEYVSNGDGTAREINHSDIDNLPAGYIVIWIPEVSNEKYEEQAGHIAITNGNGQGFADATDNLGWGTFATHNSASGKGEHGKFVVYKLSDNWEVDAATGKLKLKT